MKTITAITAIFIIFGILTYQTYADECGKDEILKLIEAGFSKEEIQKICSKKQTSSSVPELSREEAAESIKKEFDVKGCNESINIDYFPLEDRGICATTLYGHTWKEDGLKNVNAQEQVRSLLAYGLINNIHFITYRKDGSGVDPLYGVDLTEKAGPFVKNVYKEKAGWCKGYHFDITFAEVILGKKNLLCIQGITNPAEFFGHQVCTAEYIWNYKFTPFGMALYNDKVNKTYSGTAEFILYDDGWRINALGDSEEKEAKSNCKSIYRNKEDALKEKEWQAKTEANRKEIVKKTVQDSKFVFIQPGTFTMGYINDTTAGGDETPHKVIISKPFHMQATEVTQGQWKAIMGENPSFFKDCGDDCPVETVSWNDIQQFIKKLNQMTGQTYRLPTEAEWEYVCRAGTLTPFNTGKCLSTDQANCKVTDYNYYKCPDGKILWKTVAVAIYPSNAWGFYDMHGNVYEWCQDWYGDYPSEVATDPMGPSYGKCQGRSGGECRVVRGGSWGSEIEECRSSSRTDCFPISRSSRLGFRLVRSLYQQNENESIKNKSNDENAHKSLNIDTICKLLESEANKVLSALICYFSEPAHMSCDDINLLLYDNICGFKLNPSVNATLAQTGTGNQAWWTVKVSEGGKTYTTYMGTNAEGRCQ